VGYRVLACQVHLWTSTEDIFKAIEEVNFLPTRGGNFQGHLLLFGTISSCPPFGLLGDPIV
jgi:hypothetical protein